MRTARVVGFFCLLTVLAFSVACTPQPPAEAPDTRAADEAAIRQATAEMLAAAQAKDADGVVSYFAEDVVVHYANFPQQTKHQAHETWAAVMANAGYAIEWGPQRVEVARSGDVAFEQGSYEFTQHDARGRPLVERGTYVQCWRKQADGSWKISVNVATATPAN
jgi:uncharacterized protein (TIGR02246 family)